MNHGLGRATSRTCKARCRGTEPKSSWSAKDARTRRKNSLDLCVLRVLACKCSLSIWLRLVRRTGFDRQRMDAMAHQFAQRVIDHAVLLHARLAGKRAAGDAHPEVPAALACVADVHVALVDDLKPGRRERLLQSRADVLGRRGTHGRVWRKGRTVTSRYTPA